MESATDMPRNHRPASAGTSDRLAAEYAGWAPRLNIRIVDIPCSCIPGLKIVAPSNPADAKGLLKSAIRDDDPVLVFEDGPLGVSTGEVPEGNYLMPLGKAARSARVRT